METPVDVWFLGQMYIVQCTCTVLYVNKSQICTVESAPVVIGLVFMLTFRLFLAQCMSCHNLGHLGLDSYTYKIKMRMIQKFPFYTNLQNKTFEIWNSRIAT